MSSTKRAPVKNKKNDETPKKTQTSPLNHGKNDIAQQITNLESEIKRLRIENAAFKNMFDLRNIIKELSQKGVTEVDTFEMAKDSIKMALEEADRRHSEEKKDMEKKHANEIEQLSRKPQTSDQQQAQSTEKSTDKQEMDAEIKRLQDEIKALKQSEEQNRRLNENEKKALVEENQKLKEEVQKLQNENKEQKQSYEKSQDLMENEKKALVEENQKLKKEVQKLQNENKEPKQSYEKSKDLMEKEKSTDKQKMDAEIKRLQDEIKALKQSEEQNRSLNEKLKKVEEAKDNLNQQMQALQKENNELKYRLKESQSPPLSKVISANDNKTVEQLRVENERLRSRLSELAGAQMTHNNPNIADLSDGFRPTKLSEEYSQLYDNLWTDAFEEHNGKKEEDIIKILTKGLLGSYEFCENVCKEFTVQLTNSTLALPNSKPRNELQDIPIVYQKQLQDMKKSFGVLLMNDVKESYRKTQNAIEGGKNTKNYIDACVELCWLMVIQDPPVVIETPASKESAFDTNTYRAYTTTGTKVDFVVWPALRLHQGGPLLSKGVAQGKN